MRTTTATLSMLLLTGGLYASNVSAATVPACDCRDTCVKAFRACLGSALVTQARALAAEAGVSARWLDEIPLVPPGRVRRLPA